MSPVTVGQQDDTDAVVSTGVKAGDTVITSGFQKLTDGAKVKPSEDQTVASSNAAPAIHQQGLSPATTDQDPSAAPQHHHGHRQRPPSQTE